MKVYVSLDHRFESTPDGRIWTLTSYDHGFFQKYLDVFDKVLVVARVKDTQAPEASFRRADGDGVEFIRIPYYFGPGRFVARLPRIKKVLNSIDFSDSAVIARIPGTVSFFLTKSCVRRGQPFALEIISDPDGFFSPGSLSHPLRRLFRWWFARNMEDRCRHAIAISYVTDSVLQKKFQGRSYSTAISSIMLQDGFYASEPRVFPKGKSSFVVVFVGYFDNLVKAPDVLIDAVNICVKRGMDIQLRMIGEGCLRGDLEKREAALELGDRITFLGRLPSGGPIIGELDKADLFVLPSWQEGLPRAMVEAMARGLPCIGTNVGGIPELIGEEFLARPGDAVDLANRIMSLVQDPERMSYVSRANLERAQDFRSDILARKRREFYRYIESATRKEKG